MTSSRPCEGENDFPEASEDFWEVLTFFPSVARQARWPRGQSSAITRAHPPVDEVLLLQVLHRGGDLCGHVEQHDGRHLLPVALSEVIQQVPVGHVLCDDVKGRLQSAHAWQCKNTACFITIYPNTPDHAGKNNRHPSKSIWAVIFSLPAITFSKNNTAKLRKWLIRESLLPLGISGNPYALQYFLFGQRKSLEFIP